jgi:hypothetical protein
MQLINQDEFDIFLDVICHGLFTSIYIKKKLNQLHTRHSNLNRRGIFNKEGFVCTVSEIIGKFR